MREKAKQLLNAPAPTTDDQESTEDASSLDLLSGNRDAVTDSRLANSDSSSDEDAPLQPTFRKKSPRRPVIEDSDDDDDRREQQPMPTDSDEEDMETLARLPQTSNATPTMEEGGDSNGS